MAKSDKYIYSVLLNFLFIKESWKKLSSTTVFHIDNKQCFWAAKKHIRMISEGLCDTEYWSNDAEHSAVPQK